MEPIYNWYILKAKIKQIYPSLRDEELNYKEGSEDELLAQLHTLTGKSKKEILHKIQELQKVFIKPLSFI
ncbi:MAG TPA: hypothetical protein VE912_13150 [Bacteroidales bacterium]|nr:hypothetical protein [Bacteroidales bacterium]